MDDNQLLRYNRQILLPQIDIAGQQALFDAHITLIGLGGLGCPAAMYLAAAGVGRLTLIDYDRVELTNLQRQLAYTQSDIGQYKVAVMAKSIARINPDCKVTTFEQGFDIAEHHASIQSSQVVIDATDQFEARQSINNACFKAKTPLVFAAAIRMAGQLSVFDPRSEISPCYQCVYGDIAVTESCSESGVLGPVVGTLGLMQATEAIKLITKSGHSPVGRLLLYDAQTSEWQTIKILKKPDCPICQPHN